MSKEQNLESVIYSWTSAFKRATDFDAWGQPLEAIDVYQRVSKQLYSYGNRSDSPLFTEQQKKTLEKVALCLDSRCRALQANASNHVDCISLDDLRRLEKTLQDLIGPPGTESLQKFPVDVSVASAQFQTLTLSSVISSSAEDISFNKGAGTLLPKPLPISGKTLLTITIEKIDLKDPSQYLDPFVSISVKDPAGKALTATQDTPVASRKEDAAIIFNTSVHIQKTLESLPPGFAVFFEFKHFKPKKNLMSTKCWAFMENDEIKEGPLALEIYKKPTDFRRKTLKLLTTKPMYLQVRTSLFS